VTADYCVYAIDSAGGGQMSNSDNLGEADEKLPASEAKDEAQPQSQAGAGANTNLSMQEENDLLTVGKSLLENPKVKTYIGRMSKVMLLFAILGCGLMIAAVTAISTVFSMFLPK
jgi:hypothetical protein